MQILRTGVRALFSLGSGTVTFLATMTGSCDDIGGVSSWERCRSWLQTPILEWPGGNYSVLVPLAIGIGVGVLVWWLLGFTPLRRSA